MSEETRFFEMLFRTPTNQFTDTLNMFMLVDIGIIEEVDVNGRASISLSKVRNGSPVQLKDVEVIGIGNNNGSFTVDGSGCPCLLFAPRTTMPNVKNTEVDWSAPSYSKGGIKALPISNGRDLLVNACFSSDGTLNIITDNYTLGFTKDLISLTEQIGLSLQIDAEGDISLYRKTEQSGTLKFLMSDEGLQCVFKNSENTSSYTTQLTDGGEFIFSHIKPGTQEEVLNELTISDNGEITITAPGNIQLNIGTDGNISINTDGNVDVSSKGNISINTDGDADISVSGDAKLSASSFNFNNGHLEIS